ncbi:unnamed protein product [Rotaria sp. Silwood2]|nr:unnamed protein product [Rotaria sp. Silwood2]CAF2681038.1 unnamed protein product [Rotaria sp. Silwood2]CAF2952933.1 unnamed protein product [Rotaria sp. Silwood2]CAF3096226.1 unnamed protein product [Rotaria sp. Silwood2]CAF3900383.1 unnamed protein product [Rotaria sp. Silwood2]
MLHFKAERLNFIPFEYVGHRAAVKAIDISGRKREGVVDPNSLAQSFQKEVAIAYKMRLATRHVVTIYGFDFDMHRGLALMAMELGGDSLSRRIQQLHDIKDMKREYRRMDGMLKMIGDYIPPRERKNIWKQLFNVVQTLHRHRVVHCDMKPDNLVFFGPIMKIVDLGIAQKEVIGSGPSANPIGGTHYFSAPECWSRGVRITSKADIWSAGAILYNMTYGVAPITSSFHPPSNMRPTSSPHVNDVLNHCLQQDPDRRESHHWLAQHPYTTDPTAL